ncbi:hypothetical protein RHGRI_014558 [Rhododendron griersonianum]|uniref:RING-type domain-containing protein n=1 Tax=Rhododendron griersonianum TaxID=479676 RepID=A0AAV6K9T1_9ERIC|nr:hypothetical protein RHGRI_014558 [Rhododendron griersonianum]
MPNKDNANTLRNAELSKSFPKTNHIPIPQTITNPRNPNLFLPFLLLHHPSNPPVPKPLGNPLPPPLPPANSLIANANGSGKMLRLDATKQRDFSTHFVGLRYPILLFLFLAHVMRFGIWVWLRFENERAEVWLRVGILEGKGEKEGRVQTAEKERGRERGEEEELDRFRGATTGGDPITTADHLWHGRPPHDFNLHRCHYLHQNRIRLMEHSSAASSSNRSLGDRKGENMVEDKGSCSTSGPCPICLGPFLQESYLDHCFHKFCYNCIMRWAKVVASKHSRQPSSVKCPLCKTENFSIIHSYDGNSFQQHYINQDFGMLSFQKLTNIGYSATIPNQVYCCYHFVPVDSLINTFKAPQYRKSRKYFQPNQWLEGWLRREIQALLQEEDVEIIVHHILGVIDSLKRSEHQNSPSTLETREETFKALVCQAARPFLTGRTDRFVHEVELFLASGFSIDAYDKLYMQHLGWKPPGSTTEEVDGESSGNAPNPFLYIFDDDSDGND